MAQKVIHVVVYQPENVGNLGNIIRICYIYGAHLHLIRPYGWVGNLRYFQTTNQNTFHFQGRLVRAAVGCLQHVPIYEHNDWHDFYQQVCDPNFVLFFTKLATMPFSDWLKTNNQLQQVYLVFGSETFGLHKLTESFNWKTHQQILLAGKNYHKSHNLANAVAIGAHLAWISMAKQD